MSVTVLLRLREGEPNLLCAKGGCRKMENAGVRILRLGTLLRNVGFRRHGPVNAALASAL